jgi:acyl carrier protein
LPEVRLVNQYGPTEATIDATWHPLERGAVDLVVPIGRAFPNCAVRVLDAAFAPTPLGSAGELVLGGACLARGYLGRPDLTAERFVPDPFGAAGDRLYRTGDLARWLPGGRIAYLGRIDGQVKVRGVRIEPAEVEAALRRLPGVRQAAVVALEDLPGGAALVAYLVPESAAATVELEEGALRTALRATLPAFLVPAFFVVLDGLPLNAAGKLDRRALPRPGAERRQDASYVAPRSPLEEALVEIWAEVLHRSPVGVHDNFFEIGGHSLLAIQALSRLRDALGVELPVRTLFESPTVAELSVAVVTLMMEMAGEGDLEDVLGELEEDPDLSPVV